jgi:DNA-binding beta-propeller fold protein YncE
VTTGFGQPQGMIYDGSHMWVTDLSANALLRLNPDGSIAETISVATGPTFPVFDGTNIWVPGFSSNSLTVVRVKDASGNPLANSFVVATLTSNGLSSPLTAAFDGERILVTNPNADVISVWKAADLTPLGTLATGIDTHPLGACSDGLNFWITLGTNKLARF